MNYRNKNKMDDIDIFHTAYKTYCSDNDKFYKHTDNEMNLKELIKDDFTKTSEYEILHKPKGLWFSYGRKFFDWEYSDSFIVGSPLYFYELILENYTSFTSDINNKKQNNILIVKPNDIPIFHEKYFIKYNKKCFNKLAPSYLDNETLQKEFGGIFFKDYEKIFSLDYLWYNGIDASSLVLWNIKLIKKLKLIGKYEDIKNKPNS